MDEGQIRMYALCAKTAFLKNKESKGAGFDIRKAFGNI